MKVKYFILAAAALAFAACASDDLGIKQEVAQTTEEDGAVQFDVYVGRGLTRAGIDGPLTTDGLKTGAFKDAGFGVFGYYTDGERYSGITKPNFFYNQQVTFSDPVWSYTPIKYWPNEFGSDAISDQVDRVTLFAYAPWVDVAPLTGTVTGDQNTNIIGMSRNNVTGDPFVKYVATMDATNSVDLCYGVAAADFTSSNSSLNQNNIKKGKPYIDVVKPGIDANSKIKFDFKHATAQLKVTVDAVVNEAKAVSTDDVQADYTRIWIRSVTFEGITQKGALNLNGGEWYDVNGTNKITTGSLTVYDGRKDGKEAILEATNETPSTINSKLIQSQAYTLSGGTSGTITAPNTTDGPGVTKTAENLFVSSNLDDPVFVIPTNEKMKVTIVYDVETVDPKLAYYLSDGSTQGSTIENSISKTIETFGNITAGYCYTLNLHLGMRTVDFDAVVTAWQDQQADVDLPSNLQTYAALADPSVYPVTLGAEVTSYEFAMSKLRSFETVTAAEITNDASNILSSGTTNSANGAGIAKQGITVAKNYTTFNRTASCRWKCPYTGSVRLDFTQQAHALNMRFSNWPYDTYLQLVAGSGVDGTQAWGDTALPRDASHIRVWKNGQELTYTTDFTFEEASGIGRVKLVKSAVAGDNFRVWIQSGDAPAEELTVTYP